jgi:3-deoxy-D-arabino-heptulosonate 7-phosphate (DAHP) synthase class II
VKADTLSGAVFQSPERRASRNADAADAHDHQDSRGLRGDRMNGASVSAQQRNADPHRKPSSARRCPESHAIRCKFIEYGNP